MTREVALSPGWLARDVARARLTVLRELHRQATWEWCEAFVREQDAKDRMENFAREIATLEAEGRVG